ncbi:argininosuccinate lyase [Trichoderma arundinaceum]|uniref:Arginosuccinase n=1 Tax=Trichoderma arundinaceum TaxID=490622 RepID=A0A395NWZ4_TRIAR|nr:argininosuccinate lyase [Trichoderma arundinaceum]
MASDSKPSGAMLLQQGLHEVEKGWEAGTFTIVPGVDEDIFTANKRRLGAIIGKNIAGKLHTGRSRNEKVVCDMKMSLRDELRKIEEHLISFLNVIAARAEQEIDYVMPGYLSGLSTSDGAIGCFHIDFPLNTLGCGALAGNPFGIDRDMITKELGFDGLIWNSIAGVSDRDFVSETLQRGAAFIQHISRWAEDLIIYSTAEFGFVRLSDAYSTGSSLMPQNSDGLELLRGKSGRAFGHMAGLMMTQKGFPTVSDSIQIANGVPSTLNVDGAKMKAALDPFMLVTDVTDYLARKGVPFRETHRISGR